MDAFISTLTGNWDIFSQGFLTTIKLFVIAAAGCLVVGTVLAMMRVSPVPVLRGFGATYVNIIRNTPLTLVFAFMVFAIPKLDVNIDYFPSACIALIVYTSAFVCEVLRSGINTVPLGQAEAARSIGLSFGQTMRMVVLPQAFRAVIGPLGSVLIALIKNTTIAAAIGVPEAFYTMRNELQNYGDIVIPIFAGYALFFVALTLPAGLIFGWMARRWQVAR